MATETHAPPTPDSPGLRPPETVMRLERMGAAFATRLSFMRVLLRRMARENWDFSCPLWKLDANGFGRAVLLAQTPVRRYALVVFTADLPADQRTDRVIAEAWDATFSLFDGVPSEEEIDRLAANTPRQEAGRFRPSELVLGRANRSVRLFDAVVEALAAGRQPEAGLLEAVGYLMRTTAVYGSGKFGCADRTLLEKREELRGSFQVELLAVYLFRWFTLLQVNHLARARGGAAAASLDPALARGLGIGNATGLGMAPFLVRHPALVHRWVAGRETALARVRALGAARPADRAAFRRHLDAAIRHVGAWRVEDARQQERNARLRADLERLSALASEELLAGPRPWEALHRAAAVNMGPDAQELLLSVLLEPQGALVDDLADGQWAREEDEFDPSMTQGVLRREIETRYRWALEGPTGPPARFWYYSAEKLEPRLGWREREPGAALAMPLAIAHDVHRLRDSLEDGAAHETVAALALRRPDLRHAIGRVQGAARHPYAEIHDDLAGAGMRPVDLLRFKLALFGATRFDPRSDLWTRITLYQGAPLPGELEADNADDWAFPAPLDRPA